MRWSAMMIVAIFAALSAAFCFAVSAVLQQRAARRAPRAKALRVALLLDLLRRPMWLVGLIAAAAGFGLQGLALHYGSLALVQPIMLLNLLFALPIAASLRGHSVRPLQWISGTAIAGSVGLFLVVANPHGGRPQVERPSFAVLVCVLAACVAVCVLIARHAGGRTRTILLACSAGLLFGLLAAVLDSVTYLLAHRGVLGTLGTWEPYLLALVAPAGEIFAQRAYQDGTLPASLPVLNTVEPGSAIAIGTFAFGEHIVHSPTALVLEVLTTFGVIAGVITLGETAVDSASGAVDLAPPRSRSDTARQVDLDGAVVEH
jgi:drug/metabolite transporter (DMT)-like permease